jgi:hypothetical protein
MIALLNVQPYFSNACRPPRGIASPVIAMEVVRNAEEVDAILGEAPSPDREAMRIKQYVDFGFIAAYFGLFAAARRLVGGAAGWAVAICGAAAGAADVIENIGILRVVNADLRHTTQAMIDAIRVPSLIKWTLVWVALVLLGRFFVRQQGWQRRAVGVANLAAAALGFYGLFDNAFLVIAGLPMLVGLIGVAVLGFSPTRQEL